jgi:hypothetical protein
MTMSNALILSLQKCLLRNKRNSAPRFAPFFHSLASSSLLFSSTSSSHTFLIYLLPSWREAKIRIHISISWNSFIAETTCSVQLNQSAHFGTTFRSNMGCSLWHGGRSTLQNGNKFEYVITSYKLDLFRCWKVGHWLSQLCDDCTFYKI